MRLQGRMNAQHVIGLPQLQAPTHHELCLCLCRTSGHGDLEGGDEEILRTRCRHSEADEALRM